MVILVKPVLPNAQSPIEVTEEGIVMLVKLLQRMNAALPIEVTEEGMVTLFKLLQFLKALFPIDVTGKP